VGQKLHRFIFAITLSKLFYIEVIISKLLKQESSILFCIVLIAK